ncbi:MAG: acyl-CoA desaturase [Rhabdochlamydiaceae bacterium]|nr:acyl-CoA desaturase [Rhabdochlamydiaceae bacterium]
MEESKKISFNKEAGCEFHSTLKKRINQYFQGRQISPKANISMYIKSFFLIGLVALTYIILLADMVGGLGVIALYTLLGVLISIGTMNIAHDALHNAYASTSGVNRLLGYLMDLSGASSFYWKKEHTVDHHTFTNIIDHDSDLDVPILLRVCPNAPHRFFHRFQHWYAPLLYSLNLIRWVYYSDLKRIYHIFKNPGPGTPSYLERFLLILFKLTHISLFLVVGLIVLSVPFWQVLVGYICLLGAMGLMLTIIFQLAHIVENVAFPLPNAEGKIEHSFAKHQLMTTSDFATKSKLINFLFGGLNHQVEHHIFPHICHIHLRKISPIVRSTALEFGVPYHENRSFLSALRSHFGTLKKLGQAPRKTAT